MQSIIPCVVGGSKSGQNANEMDLAIYNIFDESCK